MGLRKKYIFIFLVFSFLLSLGIHFEKENKIKEYLQSKTNYTEQKYFALYNEYKKISKIIFTTDINKQEVIDIFKDAHTSSKEEKTQIRDELYNKLKSTYKLLRRYNIKQLHFHLPNNDSFLRFHRPSKFGDNLTKIRDTIVYTNKNKKSVDGFEEGRIFNGYRYVFPLFDKDTHIGSVEISFSTLAFNLEFTKNYKELSNFMIKKSVVDKKVFDSEKKNYINSFISNYYFEKKALDEILKVNNIDRSKFNQNMLSRKTLKILKKGISTNISLYDTKVNKVLTFLPIINPISKENVGLFVVKSKPTYIHNKINNFYAVLIVLNTLLLAIFIFIYKNHKKRIKLNTIINEADSGIGIMDISGNFLDVNEVYCDLLGYSRSELLQLNCSDLTHKDDRERSEALLKKAFYEGSISKERKVCRKKDGSYVILEFSLNLLPSNKQFIAVINSLEEKLKLEKLNENLQEEVNHAVEEIRQKDQMLYNQSKTAALGEMIDAIAHQWKSPLGIIKLYLQQIEFELERKDIEKKEIAESVDSSMLQITHLVNTIDEFRTFFRPTNKIEQIPIKAVVDSVTKLMKDELIKNLITVEIKGDTTAVFAIIPNEFKHVLINLFSNSKDAFNENDIKQRNIVVEIIDNKDSKQLNIYDNAGGIPEKTIAHIFEANFTTKEEGKGTGVGLYLTKQIIEKVGGTIEVTNTNNGACFSISIHSNSSI